MAFVSIQGIGGGSGKDEEEKSVALDFSNGNQVVLPNSGATLSKVTVQKPALFVAENIRYGVTLGGVVGSYSGESEPAKPEETKTVALDLSLGNQTVEPTSGYVMTGVVITKPNTLKPENVKVGVNIAGVQGTYGGSGTAESDLDGIVDGTITTFAMPLGKTSVYKYSFYQMTSLTSADLTGAITVGQYAFNGCTGLTTLTLSDALTSVEDYAFDGCNQVTSISIPTTLTNIGQYAFRNVGGASCEAFSLTPDDECTVGQYAFSGSKITAVEGSFATIGNYAFSGATKLAEVDIAECASLGTYAFQNCAAVSALKIKVNGSLGDYAFYGCTSVSECDLDANSVITSLGQYAFSRFGGNRENPSENIIELDLRNSKFMTVSQYAFGGDNATDANRNRYMNIRLPRTVTTVSAYAFRYVDNVNVYFATDRPPTFSAATSFNNATNYKIFVPYTAVNAYRTATNLTAFADNVYGYATVNTFTVGEKLPEYNAEGYALTWFKDKAMTEEVTVVDDANAEYFCVVGTEKLAYGIKSVSAINTTLSITDAEGNSYRAGSGVPIGAVVTITATPVVDDYVPYIFTVNDEEFTSGGTYTMDADLKVVAIYYDGENIPINPTFAENSWLMIGEAFASGVAWDFWQTGDEKQFTTKSGKTYTARIVDDEVGRFNIVNGGLSNNLIEFVECVNINNKSTFAMNATKKEGYYSGGGFAKSDINNDTMPLIFDDLPDDLQEVIATVEVSTYSYTAPTPRTSECKLFIKSEYEAFGVRKNASASENTSQLKWYKEHNTNADRQRHVVGGTANVQHWLRSPYSSYSGNFCVVTASGASGYFSAYNTYAVLPCFVIGKSNAIVAQEGATD